MAKRRTRIAEIVLTSFLIALFLLIGVAGMLWVVQSGALAGPTPTPTATPGPSFTPTFDFRATRIAEDMLTQVAYSVVLATKAAETLAGLTPSPTATETPSPTPAPAELPTVEEAPPTLSPIDASATVTDVSVSLPIVAGEGQPVLTAVVTATATIDPGLPPGVPPPTLTDNQTAPATDTPLPETPTPLPPPATPTPPPPPSPTPTQGIVVNSMKAVVGVPAVGGMEAKVFVGPGSVYTPTNPPALAPGTVINLFGRDPVGEWVYMCCLPGTNTSGWVRSARAAPTENPTPVNAPANTNGDDIRLLPVSMALPNATPFRTPTPIPPDDYPLYRRDSSNQGRVPILPRPPFAVGLAVPMSASAPFQSGVVVFGQQVVAASTDGHVYSFDRLNGNQRWRYQLGEQTTFTPAVANNVVYALTPSGRIVAIDENGQVRWQQGYGFQARHSIISGFESLYVVGRAGTSDRLFVLDQSNGTQTRDWPVPEGDTLTAPALGGQLIFTAGRRVWALDAFNYDTVWRSNEITFTSAPVYSAPGVHAAAELYVADENGTLLAFNANTGGLLMQSTFGEPMTSLAVNSRFVVGVGQDGATVRAFDRNTRSQAWAQTLSIGQIVGGPIVDEERVLVASSNGMLQLIDLATGTLLPTNVQVGQIVGSLAVSGQYIFAPSNEIFAAYQTP